MELICLLSFSGYFVVSIKKHKWFLCILLFCWMLLVLIVLKGDLGLSKQSHLQIVTVLPLPFQSAYFLFLFLLRIGILTFFLNWAGRLSTLRWLWVCHKWPFLYSDMFSLYSIWWKFLSWMDDKFWQMPFLYSLRWSCVLYLSFC